MRSGSNKGVMRGYVGLALVALFAALALVILISVVALPCYFLLAFLLGTAGVQAPAWLLLLGCYVLALCILGLAGKKVD